MILPTGQYNHYNTLTPMSPPKTINSSQIVWKISSDDMDLDDISDARREMMMRGYKVIKIQAHHNLYCKMIYLCIDRDILPVGDNLDFPHRINLYGALFEATHEIERNSLYMFGEDRSIHEMYAGYVGHRHL